MAAKQTGLVAVAGCTHRCNSTRQWIHKNIRSITMERSVFLSVISVRTVRTSRVTTICSMAWPTGWTAGLSLTLSPLLINTLERVANYRYFAAVMNWLKDSHQTITVL
jgi:hypothetical protein